MRTRKAQRRLFLVRAKKLLLDLGAQQEEDEFILQTRAGRLKLRPASMRAKSLARCSAGSMIPVLPDNLWTAIASAGSGTTTISMAGPSKRRLTIWHANYKR